MHTHLLLTLIIILIVQMKPLKKVLIEWLSFLFVQVLANHQPKEKSMQLTLNSKWHFNMMDGIFST